MNVGAREGRPGAPAPLLIGVPFPGRHLKALALPHSPSSN
jgi:hypothetical protein